MTDHNIPRTIQSIMASFTGRVERREIISTDEWVQAAQMLVVLQGDEIDKLYDAEQEIAKARLDALSQGKSVAAARLMVEATDAFWKAKRQRARIDQVTEFIRTAKLQARLRSEEMRQNL